jgi:hypothetical protein
LDLQGRGLLKKLMINQLVQNTLLAVGCCLRFDVHMVVKMLVVVDISCSHGGECEVGFLLEWCAMFWNGVPCFGMACHVVWYILTSVS